MPKPNILLITSDQQHYDTLGIDNPRIQTPALDRLAREGMLLDRAYCSNPVCSPSRASILTGLYPAWHDCWTIGVKLPEDVPTVNQVDFAPTFLSAAGLPIPGLMQGVDQSNVWRGEIDTARDHAIVENRHQPTKLHLRTYVDARYKITVYRGADYGELFDLQPDPNETRNLWDDPTCAALKTHLLQRFVQAEIAREPTRMPRIANA